VLWKILWFRLAHELPNDLCPWHAQLFDEVLQLLGDTFPEPQHEALTIGLRVMRPDVDRIRTPAFGKVIDPDLSQHLPYPSRSCGAMSCRGLLHLLKEFGFEQHTDCAHRARDGPVNGPSPCLGEPPRHGMAQDGWAFPVEGSSQLRQLGMRLGIEAGLVTDTWDVLDLDFHCSACHADALFEGGLPWYLCQFPVPIVRVSR
jgi:hypothetical protein